MSVALSIASRTLEARRPIEEGVDVAHVPVPIEIGTGISVPAHASIPARFARVRNFVVPDYVPAVYGDTILMCQGSRQLRGGPVHSVRKGGRVVYVTLVLYAYAGLIVAWVSSMACDVFLAHRLCYEAVGGPDDVVTRSGSLL